MTSEWRSASGADPEAMELDGVAEYQRLKDLAAKLGTSQLLLARINWASLMGEQYAPGAEPPAAARSRTRPELRRRWARQRATRAGNNGLIEAITARPNAGLSFLPE